MKSVIPYSELSHFPLENIPFGVFSTAPQNTKRVGTRIGDKIVDLALLSVDGHFKGSSHLLAGAEEVFAQPSLNAFMSLGRPAWREARTTLQKLFSDGDSSALSKYLIDADSVIMHFPAQVGDYTDFYASKEHATNVGTMFRGKDNALMPNWTRLPVGYHGRASSLVVSGTPIKRPCGQRNTAPKGEPPKVVYGPSVRMDFELEMAFFVGTGNELGSRITLKEAPQHVFGVALMNDWSARDIQAWEYVPLGPFLGKSFSTSISPWIVTMDALEPFLVAGPKQDPEPLDYIREPADSKTAINVELQVDLKPSGGEWNTIAKTNLKYMYWSIGQQVAHHTVNGCNLRTGDVLATGTISGPTPNSFGSMLELAWTGTRPIELKNQVKRTFLEDGDELKLTGWAQGEGYRVGFGECTGVIVPATP